MTNINKKWYSDAANYWDKIPSTVEGMLGGFGSLTQTDCETSIQFVKEFWLKNQQQQHSQNSIACDCGAGIGRVSKGFLLKLFDKVDLVEQNPKFLEQADKDFTTEGIRDRLDKLIPLGLQDFVPDEKRYDVIWCQWVLGHLTDDDLVRFFERCKKGLKEDGFIGVKENTSLHGVEVDTEDSSVTRPAADLEKIFKRAGLMILKNELQKGFPKGLFPVRLYILR